MSRAATRMERHQKTRPLEQKNTSNRTKKHDRLRHERTKRVTARRDDVGGDGARWMRGGSRGRPRRDARVRGGSHNRACSERAPGSPSTHTKFAAPPLRGPTGRARGQSDAKRSASRGGGSARARRAHRVVAAVLEQPAASSERQLPDALRHVSTRARA